MKKFLIPMMIALPLVLVGCDDDENFIQEVQEDIQDTKEDFQEDVQEVKEDLNINTNGSTTIRGNGYEITEIGNIGNSSIISDNDGYYVVSDENGTFGLMDNNGNMLFSGVTNLTYNDGFAVVSDDGGKTYYYADVNGNKLIDKVNGKSIGVANPFDGAYAIVELYNDDGTVAPRNCVIDAQGNVVLESTEDNKYFVEIEDGAYVLTDSENVGEIYGIYSANGTQITAEQLDDPENYDGDNIYESEDLYFIKDDASGLYALYDFTTNSATTDYIFSDYNAEEIEDNYLVSVNVNGNNNTCLIDYKGKVLTDITAEYPDALYPNIIEDRIVLNSTNGGKTILLNRNGKVADKTDFDSINETYDGETYGQVDGKYVYLKENFKPLTDDYYDYVGNVENNTSLLVKDGILYKYTEFED